MLRRFAYLTMFATLLSWPLVAQDKKKDAGDDLLDDVGKGTRVRLVTLKGDKLEDLLYWRRHLGDVAACTAPVRFRLADQDVIAPVLNPKAESSGKDAYVYPTEGRVKLAPGRHVLRPGAVSLTVKGVEVAADHPAIKIDKGEILVRCAPVRLEVVDERGAPVATPVRIGDERGTFLRDETRFSVLIVYLPVGGEYTSSLGTFRVTAAGKVEGVRLSSEVTVSPEGLKKTVPVEVARSLASAPELIRLVGPGDGKKTAPSCRLFVPTVVAPGGVAWFAVSRKEYRTETGLDFAGDHLTFQIPDEPTLKAEPVREVPADVVSRATRALNTSADDLAWVAPRLPGNLLGPVSLQLTTRGLGNHRVALIAVDTGTLQLMPHRWRSVFARSEVATYAVLLARGVKAAEAKILVQLEQRKEPTQLGTITLPDVADRAYDSRLFTVALKDLPTGKHRLWLETPTGNSGKVPLHVVSLEPRSPFFTHSMSGCTACWPTSDEGLQILEDAQLEMVAATGSFSNLDTQMPRLNLDLGARLRTLGLPSDMALSPAGNDRLLERVLRHRLKFIDMTCVRASGFYMEGLSYHHSYAPNVERMVRRMQLFAQQTADYPSAWGVNYSWFPQLYGYAEGGVPTDAHVGERNRVLLESAKAAGFAPLSREDTDWVKKNATSTDAATRTRLFALMKQAVEWRRATQELGWGKHNQLYNAAVREVKPDLACTLFENAGHDEAKRLSSMFKDMSAQCYESYTDFGDWPMSSGFVTDWSKGQTPGQPVWLTTCWGTSEEGKMKSLFHAVLRGLDGGGVPMQGSFLLSTLARRGKGLAFVAQYGAVAKHARIDARVVVLAREAHAVFGRLLWDCHAIYNHLTRLGYPPVIRAGDFKADTTKVLILVKEELPLEPELRTKIEAFLKSGGKVVQVGPCADAFDGAIVVKDTPQHLWELKGFHPESHAGMWKEFERLREPLSDAMRKTGVAPLATMDANLGYALSTHDDQLRYVAVIADCLGTHSNAFEPVRGLLVSLDGTGWTVRDLVKQSDLVTEEKDGRTLVKVDLVTEPTTLLALYRTPPTDVVLPAELTAARLGAPLSLRATVRTGEATLPRVPLRLQVFAPDGHCREDRFLASDEATTILLARHDQPGVWRGRFQELLTGLTRTFDIPVAEGKDALTAAAVGPVHVVERAHLEQFAARKAEKVVIVEPDQAHVLPAATRFVEELKKQGVAVRLWQVRPEEYDQHPIRWYPKTPDVGRLKDIESGRLIGYRQSLQPFIDTLKRVHVPERGGYTDIDPPYMIGQDCVVFSGGKVAESLRAVSPWMDAPGSGQGRLLVCFSPFMAGRQALAVVAADEAGRAAALKELHRWLTGGAAQARQNPVEGVLVAADKGKLEREVVPTPYLGFTPTQRSERLLVNAAGKAAVVLKGKQDNLALVDESGKVTATLAVDPLLTAQARLDDKGSLQLPIRKVTATHPGWNFPTEVELTMKAIAADGQLSQQLVGYRGAPGTPDFEGGLRWAPDGEGAILGRSGGFFYRVKGDADWRRYTDAPPVRFNVLYPRQPVGVTFSADGRYALLTMDSRPPFGGLNSAAPHPWSSETMLFDLKSGQRVWSLQAAPGKSTYAVHSGFAALARDASLAAFADYDGAIYLVDRNGKIVITEKVGNSASEAGNRSGPHEGVGVHIAADGKTALFAFRSQLLLVNNGKLQRLPLAGVTSACLSSDCSCVVAGLAAGTVQAFDKTGKPLWTFAPGGASPLIAAGKDNETLIATGAGELIALDPAGKELRRSHLATIADRERHELRLNHTARVTPPPVEYVEPPTLELAKKHLAARQVNAWKTTQPGKPEFGRGFHLNPTNLELTATGSGDYFVHLVYRRGPDNKSLKVVTDGKDGVETFVLDLPTPEYRVVDLPLRGPKAKVTLLAEGSVEVAEFSLWSLKWPGDNLAYVRPAGVESKPTAQGGDDILGELEGKKSVAGKLKECRVWWPNTDFDAVRGPWLPAPLDPLSVVDGKRFGGGRVAPWCNKYLNFPPCKGGFFTIDLTEEQTPTLLAAYDRSVKQSEVCAQVALYRPDAKEPLTGGEVLGGVQHNDQFWRLVPLRGKVRTLGVHVYKDDTLGAGLSEIELYR